MAPSVSPVWRRSWRRYQPGLIGADPGKRAHQGERLVTRQGAERDRRDSPLSLELLERLAESRGVHELPLARRDEDRERPALEAPRDEGEEPRAHLVGPVQVLEDDHERMACREVAERPDHAAGNGKSTRRPSRESVRERSQTEGG
jgi:hypothetical protein